METQEKLTLKEPNTEDFKKLYFREIDSTNCYLLKDQLNDARLEGLEIVTLVEAIPENENIDLIWCTYHGEVIEKEDCKKSICPYYSSKSGRGKCEHKGNLYGFGDEVKFKVPTNE